MGCCCSRGSTEPKLYVSDLEIINGVVATEISVLTYNIFLRPPGISNPGGDYKTPRLTEFGRAMEKYDIIGLQEMFWRGSNRFRLLREFAENHGFINLIKSPVPGFSCKCADGGLTILSKYPIVDYDFELFRYSNSSDSFAAKGILYARIVLNQNNVDDYDDYVNIHVFNTHLNATYEGTEIASRETRSQQVIQLQQFILSKTEYDDHPVLLLGDFNINAKDDIGDSNEYLELITCLNNDQKYHVQDILKEELGLHPNTYGDVYSVTGSEDSQDRKYLPKDTILTDDTCYGVQERLDYLFFISKKKGRKQDVLLTQSHLSKQKDSQLILKSTQLQPFLVHDEIFGQLSDHYGIEAEFRVNADYLPDASSDIFSFSGSSDSSDSMIV